MADELIDIFDENNQHVGTAMKHKAHKEGLWHRTAHIWIYNKKGDILLQLRSKTKDSHPNLWDISAAGHIAAGEDMHTGALRETQEELGLNIKQLDLWRIQQNHTQLPHMDNREFQYIYLLEWNGKIEDLDLQEEEVSGIKFISTSELENKLITEDTSILGNVTPWHTKYWKDIINEVKIRT